MYSLVLEAHIRLTHPHCTYTYAGPLAATVWESNTAPCRNVWWAHFLYINDIYPWCVSLSPRSHFVCACAIEGLDRFETTHLSATRVTD